MSSDDTLAEGVCSACGERLTRGQRIAYLTSGVNPAETLCMPCYNHRVPGQMIPPDNVKLVQRLRDRIMPARTIEYTMTPQRFVMEIPVEALANLSHDDHTRMLAMLSDWIARHKPPKVERVK